MKGGTRSSRMLWTFVVTSLALVMVTLDNLVVTTAIPVIRKDLGTSIEGLEWTVNAYTLSFAVFLLTGAALGDRFGRRRMFAIGLGIFTLASAMAALAPSIEVLVAARAIQGLGGAIIAPLTLTILSAAVPAEKRGLALGAWGGVGGLAVALGPLVGGAVVSGLSWHWIFWINVPLGLVLVPLALRRLDETYGPEGEARPPGPRPRQRRSVRHRLGPRPRRRAGLDEHRDRRLAGNRRRPCRPVRPLGAPRRGADAAHALLPRPHIRADEPRVAADVLRDVRIDLPARAVLPDRAGLLALRLGAADPAVDGDADLRRPDRRSPIRPDRRPPADGHGARAPGDRARLDRGDRIADGRRTARLSIPFILSGVGMALFFAPVANVVLSSVKPEEEGKASGANNAIRELGGVFGVAVLASIFSHYGGYESGQAFVDGLNPAIWVGAIVVGLGSVAALAHPAEASSRRGRGREAAARPRRGGLA